jgi:hypothetical protein
MSRLTLYFSSIPVGSMVKHALGIVTTAVVVRLQPMTKTCNLLLLCVSAGIHFGILGGRGAPGSCWSKSSQGNV